MNNTYFTNVQILFWTNEVIKFFIISGLVFVGIVIQRIIDDKPVSPIKKRVASAIISASMYILVFEYYFKLDSTVRLYGALVLGFFADVVIEKLNKNRSGIIDCIAKIIKKRAKGGDSNAKD